jgi:hypothetical protein
MPHGFVVSMLDSAEDFMGDMLRDGNTDVCSVDCGTTILCNWLSLPSINCETDEESEAST